MIAKFDAARAIALCAAGDAAALKALYQHEAPILLGVAIRLVRRRAVAEEVLQETFVTIWRQARSFDPARGSPQGWMLTILRNRALNLIRKHRPETELDESISADLSDDSPDALASLERHSEASALRRCLEGLDPPKRRAIMLAYMDGCTHDQIARRLGEPLGTVKSWIRRGLIALKACLA